MCCAAVCLLFVMSVNNNVHFFRPVHVCAYYITGHVIGLIESQVVIVAMDVLVQLVVLV
jgi:hypothetical protein